MSEVFVLDEASDLVYSLGAKLNDSTLRGFSAKNVSSLLPWNRSCRSGWGFEDDRPINTIEAFERVKVLDMIDPYPSAIIHQTEGSSHLQKRMLRQKMWHPKEHMNLYQTRVFKPLYHLNCWLSGVLWSQPESILCATRSPTVRSQLSGAPDCAKAQQSRNCGGCFCFSQSCGGGRAW